MAYQKINFLDQDVERPRTYEMQQNPDGTVTLVDSFGIITEIGTPINRENMNHIEDGIVGVENNVTQVVNSLVNKLNIDHSNDTKPYIKTTYVSGVSGYRIWSDGFKECWGRAYPTNSDFIIYFPITFTDPSNANITSAIRSYKAWDGGGVNYSNETDLFVNVNSTQMTLRNIMRADIDWYVRGY